MYALPYKSVIKANPCKINLTLYVKYRSGILFFNKLSSEKSDKTYNYFSLLCLAAKSAFLVLIVLSAILATPQVASAQEFNARVTLNKSQIQNVSLDYLDDLVPLIENYINNHNWTELRFEEHERIRMNIQIILSSESNNNFEATFIVTSERPIYNTLQLTQMLVISDNAWRFNYTRNRNINHDLFQFDDIASILDFYAYFILGYDADTFSEMGGTEYFRRAQGVLEVAQATGALGWSTGTGSRRNRHYLINGILNPSHDEYRKGVYLYYRHGLDLFTNNPENARNNISESLQLIRESRRATTDDYLFELFFSSKHRELTSIFIDAEVSQRLDAYLLLTEMDNGRISEYQRLQ